MDWSKFLDLLKQPLPVLFVLATVGVAILCLPDAVAARLGFDYFRLSAKHWVGLLTAVFGGLFMVGFGKLTWDLISKRILRVTRRGHFRKHVAQLSDRERFLLGYCLSRKTTTLALPITDTAGHALRAKGFLERVDGIGNQLAWAHIIPTHVWEYLVEHPSEILTDQDMRELEYEFASFEREANQRMRI